jgi:hypothetical protein
LQIRPNRTGETSPIFENQTHPKTTKTTGPTEPSVNHQGKNMATPNTSHIKPRTPGVGGSAHPKMKLPKQPLLLAPTHICSNCGTASAIHAMPGSGWIEAILWLCYIIPGVIYSVWRRSKKSTVCASCGAKPLLPINTPAGKRLAATHYPDGIDLEEFHRPEPEKTSATMTVGLIVFLLFTLYLALT